MTHVIGQAEVDVYKVMSPGPGHCFSTCTHANFTVDGCNMIFNSSFGESKFLGNLPVIASIGDLLQDLYLAITQRYVIRLVWKSIMLRRRKKTVLDKLSCHTTAQPTNLATGDFAYCFDQGGRGFILCEVACYTLFKRFKNMLFIVIGTEHKKRAAIS